MWEDSQYKAGGRWLLNMEKRQKSSIDMYWEETVRGVRGSGKKGVWSIVVKVIMSSREWRGVGSRRKDLNPVYSTRCWFYSNCQLLLYTVKLLMVL